MLSCASTNSLQYSILLLRSSTSRRVASSGVAATLFLHLAQDFMYYEQLKRCVCEHEMVVDSLYIKVFTLY